MSATNLEDLLKQEVDGLVKALKDDVTDPSHKEAIARMTNDLAMLPIRMAKGENVDLLFASLKAEAALRGVALTLRSQAAVQQAWMNIITKVVTAAVAGVLV